MILPETYGVYLVLAGLALALFGYGWLLRNAFRQRLAWGLASLIFPPTILLYSWRHGAKARGPFAFMLAGAAVIGATYGINFYQMHHADLGPREKIVDGELHITLTGWDGTDYGVLKQRPKTVVLQMANPDVIDETLDNLRGMQNLRELDLNNTQITDRGLRELGALPKLQVLRLRKTKVTDAAFTEVFGAQDRLLEVDLRETEVASKTLREWKAKKKDIRRFMR